MEMSIDEKAIKTLNEIIDEGWLISDMEKCTAIDACEFAIDRINKYQKIEQIINNAKGSDGAVKYNWLYEQLKKVVEDG